MADKAKSSAFWWEDYDNEEPSYDQKTISIEAPEVFDHQCGFIKLRERHRVKALSRPAQNHSAKCANSTP